MVPLELGGAGSCLCRLPAAPSMAPAPLVEHGERVSHSSEGGARQQQGVAGGSKGDNFLFLALVSHVTRTPSFKNLEVSTVTSSASYHLPRKQGLWALRI